MKAFDYLVADGLDAALAEYAEGNATLKAGGLDLLDRLKERLETPDTVLSIGGLDELRYIREQSDGVHIGCLATLADLGRSRLLAEKYPVLHQSAAHAATPQIREQATLGGNLCQRPRCWYFRNQEFYCLKKGGATCYAVEGENRYHAIFGGGPCHIVHPSNVAPALVALDAVLVLRSASGDQQQVKAEDFFVLPGSSVYAENVLKPGQMIVEVILPKPAPESATVELREKQSFDWPMVIACAARVDSSWRVCLGAVAPIPWLSRPAMDVLGSRDLTPELAASAGRAATTGAEPMTDNAYKVQLVQVATERALLTAAGLEVPS